MVSNVSLNCTSKLNQALYDDVQSTMSPQCVLSSLPSKIEVSHLDIALCPRAWGSGEVHTCRTVVAIGRGSVRSQVGQSSMKLSLGSKIMYIWTQDVATLKVGIADIF